MFQHSGKSYDYTITIAIMQSPNI